MRLPRVLGAGTLLVVAVLAPVVVVRHTDTGPVLRTVPVGKIPITVAVDARTNRAFVGNSADRTMSVLDASSGTVLRTVALPVEPDIVAADPRTGRVFVSNGADVEAVLDAVSGAVLSTVALHAGIPAADDRTGRVFLTGATVSGPGTVAMLDGRSGRVLHTATVGGPYPWDVAVGARTRRAFVTSVSDDTVVVMDAATGRVLRTVSVGATPVAVAVDVQTGHVFVTNNGGDTVTMLDARTGALLRTIKVGPAPARVVVDEPAGHVFVVHSRGAPSWVFSSGMPNSQGGTTMLDARSWAVLRSVAAGGRPTDDEPFGVALCLAVDQRRGRVFVVNQTAAAALNNAVDGSVSVLDAATGRLLRTIPVGRHPITLAVDETTARLFVVNTNSGCVSADPWRAIPGSIRHRLPLISQPPKPTCNLPGSATVIDTSHL